MKFANLNDASIYQAVLAAGEVQIWYYRPELSRDMCMGLSFLDQIGITIDPTNLEKTHILLGSVIGEDLEQLYGALQGESYSPMGDAHDLIRSKGLQHTSMAIGDVVVVNGKAFAVDGMGFKELTNVNKN